MKSHAEHPLIITETTSSLDISRRHFVKRAGAATAASAFALHLLQNDASAAGNGSPEYTLSAVGGTQEVNSSPNVTDKVVATSNVTLNATNANGQPITWSVNIGLVVSMTVTNTPDPTSSPAKANMWTTAGTLTDVYVSQVSSADVNSSTPVNNGKCATYGGSKPTASSSAELPNPNAKDIQYTNSPDGSGTKLQSGGFSVTPVADGKNTTGPMVDSGLVEIKMTVAFSGAIALVDNNAVTWTGNVTQSLTGSAKSIINLKAVPKP